MKKFIFFILFSATCFSALPPLYQTSREIKRILNNPMLAEKLKGAEPIQEIKKSQNGWLITTLKHTIQVDLTYLQSEVVGPCEFKLNFHNPIEINN